MDRGHVVAFVGDGANDASALKAADVGLSLTADGAASVAAPFTAKNNDLGSVLTLLVEVRFAPPLPARLRLRSRSRSRAARHR